MTDAEVMEALMGIVDDDSVVVNKEVDELLTPYKWDDSHPMPRQEYMVSRLNNIVGRMLWDNELARADVRDTLPQYLTDYDRVRSDVLELDQRQNTK